MIIFIGKIWYKRIIYIKRVGEFLKIIFFFIKKIDMAYI